MTIAAPTAFEAAAPHPATLGAQWDFRALDRAAFAALDAEWQDLASNASEPNIFAFPAFLRASLRMLVKQKAQLLSIRSSGLLIGVAILRRDWGYGKLPVRFYRTALHHEQFLGTPLVRKGWENSFATGLFDWLDRARDAPLFLNLAQCSEGGAIAEAIARQARRESRPSAILNRFERAAIRPGALPKSGEEGWLSASRRKSLRKARKRLETLGEVRVERLTAPEDVSPWIAGFLAMEDTGWKHDSGSSILSNGHETALYDKLIRNAFENGTLNFARLCVGGRPIAYALDVTAQPLGFCIKSAIDEGYRKCAPGVLLEYETLQFYRDQPRFELVDSCTSPENAVLNELWPHRKSIADVIVGRKGAFSQALLKLILRFKKAAPTANVGA